MPTGIYYRLWALMFVKSLVFASLLFQGTVLTFIYLCISENGKLVSTLRAPGPPGFVTVQHYRCTVDPEPKDEINQYGFAIIGLRGKFKSVTILANIRRCTPLQH